MRKHLLLFIFFLFISKFSFAQWSEVGGVGAFHPNMDISTSCSDKAGNVYAAGEFTNSSGKYFVGCYQSGIWLELGGLNGLSANSYINSICSDAAGNIYAAGDFTNSSNNSYVAMWNGITWSELGGVNSLQANNDIKSVCSDAAGNIYAVGDFSNSSGNSYVAKWNGSNWIELGGANSMGAIWGTMWSVSSDNYGNVFASIDGYAVGLSSATVLRYNGNSWDTLGGSAGVFNAEIYSICTDVYGNVYAGGQFKNTSNKYYVAKYNGTAWSELGGNNALAANGNIFTVCCDPLGNVYTGGNFTSPSSYTYVAKFDGTYWGQLGGFGNIFTGSIETVCSDANGVIYTGGASTNSLNEYYLAEFYTCNTIGTLSDKICRGSSIVFHNATINQAGVYLDTLMNWGGCDSFVVLQLALIPSTIRTTYSQSISAGQSYLFNGHSLTTAGTYYDTLTNYLGCDSFITLHLQVYNCTPSWGEVGGLNALGANGNIQTTCNDAGGNIYAAGTFANSSGKYYVAKWNGTTWSELGGLNGLAANNGIGSICCDAVGNIYAAGAFTNSSGKYYVAKWDGTAWSELGGLNSLAANNYINSICIDAAGNIYAAGGFTNANGYYYVAKYNGTTWSALVLVINQPIHSICTDAVGNIYAAGSFTNSGYLNRYVAKWNGTAWSELGGINALAANGDIYSIICDASGNIYAAGEFQNSSGKRYVAKYNGTSWSEIGGLNGLSANWYIYSICNDALGNIYAAGGFTNASGNKYVAKWNGTSWSELGGLNGLAANNIIYSICSNTAGNIYAGGFFTNSSSKYYVAKFGCIATYAAINQTACPPYTFNNHQLSASGTYYDTLVNYHGADSIVTLHLTIKAVNHGTTNQTITPWSNYFWNNQYYGYPIQSSGNYIFVDTFKSYLGCDSLIDSLNLTVLNCTAINGVAQLVVGATSNICTGISYLPFITDGVGILNGSLNSWSGTVQGTTASGAISPLYSFGNTINTPIYVDTNWVSVTINYVYDYYCQGILLVQSQGQVTEPVYKTPILPKLTPALVCAGKGVVIGSGLSNSYSYSWSPTSSLNNSLVASPIASPTLATTYIVVATGAGGCAASDTQMVSILASSSSIQSVAVCAPYAFNNHQLTIGGTYFDTLTNYIGCDSFVTLHLSIKPISNSSTTASICANQTYTLPKGKIVSIAGTYKDTLSNYLGCDSIITTQLSIKPISNNTINHSICSYQSYSFHSHALNSSGTYYDTLTNYIGCDSLITLHLTVLPDSVQVQQNLCAGSTYNFNGTNISSAGTYRDTLHNQLGCDSIVVLKVIGVSTSSANLSPNICSNQSYIVGLHTYNTAGTYYDTLQNYVGCDSFIVTQLNIKPVSTHSFNKTICKNNPYTFHHQSLDSSGTYYDTLQNYVGCDSFITLHLTVKPISSSSFSQTICANHPYTFNGHPLSSSGTYYDTLTNYVGCDSFITLHLTVKSISNKTINQSICSNQYYAFNGHNLNTSGTYYDTLTNYVGCDSFITLHLTLKAISNHSFNQINCANHPYTFNGHQLTTSGTYYDTLINHLGCDSFITLHLTIRPISNHTFNKTICKTNPYFFNQHWLNVSGIYKDTLLNYVGCDSFLTLNLTVLDTSLTILQASTCSNQPVYFHQHNINASGIYYDTLLNQFGCDSTVVLHLTVLPTSSSTITDSACSNRAYHFNNLTIDSSGIYHDTIQNYLGCDSFITAYIKLYPQHPRVKNVLGKLTAFGWGYDKLTWINCDNKQFVSSANPFDVNESGNYAVVVEQGNCSDTSACLYVDIDCHLLATPNPAKDNIHIKIKCGDKAFHLVLTDVLGRALIKQEIKNQDELELLRNGLAAGIYFLYLYNEHDVKMVQKVVWE